MTDNEKKPRTGLGETVGTVAEPYLERMIIKTIRHIADSRPVEAMIRDMSHSTADVIYQALPGAIGLAISSVPDVAFKSPAAAVYIRSLINEAGKTIGDVIHEKKLKGEKATDTEKDAAAEAAIKAVDEKKVVFAIGAIHLPGCVHLTSLKPYQRQEMALKDAVEQQLKAAPCCFEGIDTELKKQAAPPKKTVKKNPSPFDVVGVMDEAGRRSFNDWLKGLTEEQRKRACDALHELDSADEFAGFMAMDSDIRLELLSLLENRNARHAVKKYLGIAGSLVKNGFDKAVVKAKELWGQYKRFNESLQPLVDEQLRQFKSPRPKPRWWKMFLPV
jgi:hypothetical protein